MSVALQPITSNVADIASLAKQCMNNFNTISQQLSSFSNDKADKAQEGWHNVLGGVGFENSWVDFDATTFFPAGYFKDTLGIVHLRGLVKSGTVNQPMFHLPADYRPNTLILLFPVSVSNSTSAGRLFIYADGTVKSDTAGSATSCTLSGITFDTRA
jgi:hypothetical protein